MTREQLEEKVIGQLAVKFGQREARSLVRILWEDLMSKQVDQQSLDRSPGILDVALQRVLAGEPVQYVVQSAHFFGLNFYVDKHVLIPRPETELLVDIAAKDLTRMGAEKRILDIGTGSGCIAITLATLIDHLSIVAIDQSMEALQVATRNAEKFEVIATLLQLDFLIEDSWTGLGYFDALCSNPPYVAHEELELMARSTIDYEPHLALFPEGEDPLIFYKKIAKFASMYLRPGGKMYLELNEFRAAECSAVFRNNVFQHVEIHKDLSGKDRILTAIRQHS